MRVRCNAPNLNVLSSALVQWIRSAPHHALFTHGSDAFVLTCLPALPPTLNVSCAEPLTSHTFPRNSICSTLIHYSSTRIPAHHMIIASSLALCRYLPQIYQIYFFFDCA